MNTNKGGIKYLLDIWYHKAVPIIYKPKIYNKYKTCVTVWYDIENLASIYLRNFPWSTKMNVKYFVTICFDIFLGSMLWWRCHDSKWQWAASGSEKQNGSTWRCYTIVINNHTYAHTCCHKENISMTVLQQIMKYSAISYKKFVAVSMSEILRKICMQNIPYITKHKKTYQKFQPP